MHLFSNQILWDFPRFWGFCALNLFNISIDNSVYIYIHLCVCIDIITIKHLLSWTICILPPFEASTRTIRSETSEANYFLHQKTLDFTEGCFLIGGPRCFVNLPQDRGQKGRPWRGRRWIHQTEPAQGTMGLDPWAQELGISFFFICCSHNSTEAQTLTHPATNWSG